MWSCGLVIILPSLDRFYRLVTEICMLGPEHASCSGRFALGHLPFADGFPTRGGVIAPLGDVSREGVPFLPILGSPVENRLKAERAMRMGEDGTIDTFYLLEHTLVVLFGSKTVPVKMFRGKGMRDPHIPAGFFAGDRLKGHPSAPVNRLAAERVVLMVEIALAGESRFDRLGMSRLVSALTTELFGVGCAGLVVESAADELSTTRPRRSWTWCAA